MQNLTPCHQTHGLIPSAVSLAHIWPHRSGHCTQSFHPVAHRDTQIYLLTLPASPTWTLPWTTWAEPRCVLRRCPLTLPVGWQRSTGSRPCVTHCAGERVTKAEERGNQTPSRFRQRGRFSGDLLPGAAQSSTNAQICHVCLVKQP